MGSATLFRGTVVTLAGSPGVLGCEAALRIHEDGGLLVDASGRISAAGAIGEIGIPDGALVESRRGGVILPGFVDAHVHFPQVYAQAGFGGGELLEWLERCIFPAEAKLADPAFAARAASDFCDALIAAGTTT